ncbi:MAG: hypothetical protein R2856_04355 [Caldilineaceae bacterium]
MTIHIGDIRNRADVDKAMQGVDIVIHTAAALPVQTRRHHSTDVDGIRTRCCKRPRTRGVRPT